jgi:hypothetical protein
VPQPTHRAPRLVLSLVFGLISLLPLAAPVAADGLTMTARVLLQGHARIGSWMAISVQLENSGPAVTGELRMDAGSASATRFSMPVDLPTNARQTYVLHAQPPVFGRSVEVDLVANGSTIAKQTVSYLVHDAGQLVVGVVAERPQAVVGELNLPASPTGAATVIVPLTVADLPDRVEGWGALDRLIWQDVDTNTLSTEQLAALRGWISGGGRLVIVGGTAGLATLARFPDDILPYRPTATLDLDPSKITSLIGTLPAGAAILPALAGSAGAGRALVTSGDRIVAGDLAYGSGDVTLIGFDPTTPWLAQSKTIEDFWRGLLPARSSGDGSNLSDDSQILGAVQQLQSLALPPVGGLLLLLLAYILIVGPVNFAILRRIDRRELAWISVPLLVVGFAAAAYGYGSVLRGSDIIVNEVAIVRGAPDATEGRAQDYFGVFSPTRATYLVEVPGGALLAAPISGTDPFGSTTGVLDVVQGDPAKVRDLAVGVAQLRTIRAESQTTVPKMSAKLALTDAGITGTFTNESDQTLEQVSIVLGGSVVVLGDVAPQASVPVTLRLGSNQFGMALADQIVGQPFNGGFPSTVSESDVRRQIRYTMIGQLTYDPIQGFLGQLQSDQPVILAFGRQSPLDVQIEGQTIKKTTNVLYYVPIDIAIHGAVTFTSDLVRPTILSTDSMFFNKGGPTMFNMGVGTLTVAYRPIPFSGTFSASTLRLGFNSGNGVLTAGGKPVEPLASVPPSCTDANLSKPAGCVGPRLDFLPEIEIFDLTGDGRWVRLPRLGQDSPYSMADPSRYVDPASGQVLLRFVNDNADNQLGFGFGVSIEGTVQ